MKYVFTLLGCILMAPLAQANELVRLYQTALDTDTRLQAAAAARDAAGYAKPQAFGALLPQINGGYDFTRNIQEQTTTGLPCSGTQFSCKFYFNTKGLSVNLSQTIFDYGILRRLSAAGQQAEAGESAYRSAKQSLALRIAEAYFGVLAANDGLRFAGAENQANERSLEQAKQRFQVGLSAITDVQEAQARYDLTVAQKIAAEQTVTDARNALTEIVGVAPGTLTTLAEEIALNGPNPADISAWVKFALNDNPDLVTAQIQADLAASQIEIARAGHFPKLGLNAQYTDGSQGGRFSSEQTQESIGLQLSVPLFSGGSVQAAVNGAAATHRQKVAELETARRQVERVTRSAYQGVLTGIAQVKALKQAVVSNTTALEASEVGLQVGARTSLDVLNAQRELYRAQTNYSKARYDYLLNVLRLKQAAGRLGEPDLQEVDRLLTAASP
ncbi:MAG: TolC family outer membrane protein [Pseudomonadota bacterium]